MTGVDGEPLQLEKLISGRGKDSGGQYTFFVENIVTKAGCFMWKPKQMRMHLMSTVVTIADEAFAMMLLMNNWERWVAKAKNDGKENDKNLPITRWTMVTEEDRSRMFCGWSLDALDVEWPKMWAKVKKDREANKAWEHEFRDKKKRDSEIRQES